MPTSLLREHVDLLTPYVMVVVNASLSQGRLPDNQKHAIVLPLIKKPGLDSADMANFLPVSNLSFLSKVIERVVTWQLNAYLTDCCRAVNQHYRRHHARPAAATLASSRPPTCSIQDRRAGVQGIARPDLLPAYLVEDCQLVPVTGRRRLPTAFVGHRHMPSATNQHVLAIAHLLLLDLKYGTVCQPNCESQMLHSDNLDEHLKIIY